MPSLGIRASKSGGVRACNVPVFRFALERWAASEYEVFVFLRGPLGPEAMEAPLSRACVLGADGTVMEWDTRTKEELGREIVRIIEKAPGSRLQALGFRFLSRNSGSF
jgi:hypothetical protein